MSADPLEGNVFISSVSLGDGEDLCIAKLSHASGSSLEVTTYGAHVTSWKLPGDKEQLYMTSQWPQGFKKGKGIRGGIPVCWPQFSQSGPLSNHGFLRTSEAWEVVDASTTEGVPSVTMRIGPTPESRAAPGWEEAEFDVTVRVSLMADSFRFELEVANNAEVPLVFTGALHTYFAVPDVKTAVVRGLKGTKFIDKVRDFQKFDDAEEAVAFVGEKVDRGYLQTGAVVLADGTGREIAICKEGWTDSVVWNIGEAEAPSLADMGPGEWQRYVCVESGVVDPETPVTVAPNESWIGTQTISCKL
mmetsp:Transcript_32911/g.85457  ORF Transcript_32911/g.85457 Transcript_32911/m.85457 type:complete len:303 (+) Transcript_32911:47-955(+)